MEGTENGNADSVEAARAESPEAGGPSPRSSPMADQEASQATLEDINEELDETQPASYLEEKERQGSPDWDEPTGEDVEMSSGMGVVSSLD